LDYNWTGLILLNGFSFLVIFLSFYFWGRAADKTGLTASFRAHVNIAQHSIIIIIIIITAYSILRASWVRVIVTSKATGNVSRVAH